MNERRMHLSPNKRLYHRYSHAPVTVIKQASEVKDVWIVQIDATGKKFYWDYGYIKATFYSEMESAIFDD